ncbi:MAG: FAD-dependent oxidoreductase [Anaerolineae bacterium]|nr:FAD-dependent oxidoreductase [Anaerolineae bacterium]
MSDHKFRVTRRSFVMGAAASAAAVAGSGILGAAAQTSEAQEAPQYEWETPPEPIPDADITETVDADVVVVGAGCAGVLAALAAAEGGADVVVLEKTDRAQGRGGDNTAIDSRIQRELGIELDKDEIVYKLWHWGQGRINMDLLYLWADSSGMVMDRIEEVMAENDLEVYLVVPDRTDDEAAVIDSWPRPESLHGWNYRTETIVEYPTCHRIGAIHTDQSAWLNLVLGKAVDLGAQVYFNTRAQQLIREEGGRVTGVVAQNEDGDYIRFNAAKAVILCTGDYGADPEMVAKYTPEKLLPGMVRTSTGDGHKMAMWVGAVMEELPHCPMSHLFHAMGTDAFLQVNKWGKRFYNEDADTESIANQYYEQGGAWVVFDSSWEEDVEKMGPGFFRIHRATDAVRADFQAKLDSGRLIQADTIEELAEKMEVPADTLQATIDRYNELAYLGEDRDYGKRADRLTPVDTPPYYAGWSGKPAFALVVLGGLLTNEKLQALDADHNVIPGLYLAGNTVGRRFKGGYPVICPGLSHSMAWTHGYLAGKWAAEEEEE